MNAAGGSLEAHLTPDMALWSLGLGSDEEAFARALRDRGVHAIVVSRALRGALDRDASVWSRLVQHDHLEWFQLRRVTSDAHIYVVRDTIGRIPDGTGDALLRGLRARLARTTVPDLEWSPESLRLVGSMRLQGATLATRHASVDTQQDADLVLDDLAAALSREWDWQLATMGFGGLAERLPDIRLEIHVSLERAAVEPRDPAFLSDLWEMGVDGVMLRAPVGEKDERFTYRVGAEAIREAEHEVDLFFGAAATAFDWPTVRPWLDPRNRLDVWRTDHFMESKPGGGAAVRLVRGAPEVPLAAIDAAHVREMLVRGGEWWLANLLDDGRYEYKYWPEQNRRSEEYNEVRHILGPRDLVDTWRYQPDDRYLVGARRGMDWLAKHTVRSTDPVDPRLPHPPEGTRLFRYPPLDQGTPEKPSNQKLGTVAVALLAWIPYAEATGDRSEDEAIREMAAFVRSMMEPNGRFRPYLVPEGHSYEDADNDIVPGEAALALGKVAAYFDDPSWVSGFPAFLDYYEPWFRERAARARTTGRWPHDTYDGADRLELVQFGPWAVMAAAQYHALTGDARAAAFGLEVADWMIDNYQWTSERAPWPDYVGGYYKLPDELPAMQTFCYSEGTAAAYAIALRFAPDRASRYERSTREAIRFMEVMMYDDLDSYWVADPGKVRGGIKYEMSEPKIRIDYVGHGLSTLVQYLDARAQTTKGPADVVPTEPSAVSR